MLNRRPLGAALAAILAGSALAAPATAQDVSPAGRVGPDDPSGEISFMVFGDPAELEAYRTLVTTFEAANPAVDVALVEVPNMVEYRQRLGQDLAAGAPADIVLINYRNQSAFSAKGQLLPLTDRLRASRVLSQTDFYPEAFDGFVWRDEVMCVPQNQSSLAVYLNLDLFAEAGVALPEAGWTWDDFLATAQALTKDTDGDGVVDQYGLGTEATLMRLAPFIWQNGGEVVNNPREPSALGVDSANAREAFQWFVDLQAVHHVVPDAIAEEAEDSESRFLNGRTAMFLQSRRIVPSVRDVAFAWDVAPLPQRKEQADVLHADGYCLPSASRNPDAAWALIEYANSPEGQSVIARTGRTVPSNQAVATSEAYLDPTQRPASAQVWLDAIPTLRRFPPLMMWPDIEEIANAEIERAFYGNGTVDEAIDAMMTLTRPYFAGAEA
jgi:multiple sugar transport system substrate-binding protein